MILATTAITLRLMSLWLTRTLNRSLLHSELIVASKYEANSLNSSSAPLAGAPREGKRQARNDG